MVEILCRQGRSPAAHVIFMEDPMLDAVGSELLAQRHERRLIGHRQNDKVRCGDVDDFAASGDAGVAGLNSLMLQGDVLADNCVDVPDLNFSGCGVHS